MSNHTFTNKLVKGKREYFDCACDHLDFMITKDDAGKKIIDPSVVADLDLNEEEVAAIQLAIDRNWLIPAGEVHRYFTGVYYGHFYTTRMNVPAY